MVPAFPSRTALAAAVIGLISGATPASATFVGANMTATYQFPTLGTVYPFATWTPPSFVVGAGTETVGDVEGVTTIAADFSSGTLSLVLTTVLNSPTWNAAGFNGPVFTAGAPLGIVGFSVDAGTTMSGFDSSRITVAANEIRINWGGLSYVSGTAVLIDFSFVAVPEPATGAVFGLGLLGLATAAGRRRAAINRKTRTGTNRPDTER